MRNLIRAILFIAFIGFAGIQFASMFDDPHHLMEPDPNCPLCLAAKTQVCATPEISISFTPNILYYLVETSSFNEDKENYLLTLSIRAPPFLIQPSIRFSDHA